MKTNAAMCSRSETRRTVVPRRRILPALIAGCFASGAAFANPMGAHVINGQASFSNQGNVLSITNTPGAIINWQSFSINAGETTRFIQQSANSAVLNRIVGQDPSKILGALQSNGRVFLINPNGILFGTGAKIDVNGLIASTLNISNEDFLAGRMNFKIGDKAGDLKNEGAITTPSGGKVYLIAPNVENSGIITSPKGEVMLAAGHTVQLVDSVNPDMHVVISAPEHQALNIGQIITQGGKTGIFGALVQQRGIVSADSAVVGENGRIVFKASREARLGAGSKTTANGVNGGSVSVKSSGATLIEGVVQAKGESSKGGQVHVLGNQVGVINGAAIDASGKTGGGTVLIGGDYQGKGTVRNAAVTYTDGQATIKADATANGNGGKVIVWADDTTRSYAHISARGGEEGGNGGFVETSGKRYLDVGSAYPDVRAPKGNAGSWLLDPENVEITSVDSNVTAGSIFQPATTGLSQLSAATLRSYLETTGSAIVDTTGGGSGMGNITVNAAITPNLSVARTLTLKAHGDIVLNAQVSASGNALHVDMQADQDSNGTGSITLTQGINSNGGNVSLRGNSITLGAAGHVYAGAGAITLTANGSNGMISLGSPTVLSSFGSGGIKLTAPRMDLANGIINSNSAVELIHNGPIKLGVSGDVTAGTLELSDAELDAIHARVLRINAQTGSIEIKNQISPQNISEAMSLFAGLSISQNVGATIHGAPALKLTGGSVHLPEANPTGVIAGSAMSGSFYYRSTNEIMVSNVDGASGIALSGSPGIGSITLESDSSYGIGQMYNAAINTNGGGLMLKSKGGVYLWDSANSITKLAAVVNSTAPESEYLSVHSSTSMEVGEPMAGFMGITTTGAGVDLSVASGGTLTINKPINVGIGEVELEADNLVLNNIVTASMADIAPFTSGRSITVGSATCNASPCLSVVNLHRIAANTIGIGRDDENMTGPIHVAAITNTGSGALTDRNSATTRIGLLSGAGVTQSGAIDVPDLAVVANGTVNLSNTSNSVNALAAETWGGDFTFANSKTFSVADITGTEVDGGDYGVYGIWTAGGNVSLTAAGTGNIHVDAGIDAGGSDGGLIGNITLKAGGAIKDATGYGYVAGNHLTAEAGRGISLYTEVKSMSATNTDTVGSSDIIIENYGPLNLHDVKQVGTNSGNIQVVNYGGMKVAAGYGVRTHAGNILLAAHSPLTIDGTVSSTSGSITLEAGASDTGNDHLTINGPVSTGGSVLLRAGNSIFMNVAAVGSSVVQQPNGNSGYWPEIGDCLLYPSLPGCIALSPIQKAVVTQGQDAMATTTNAVTTTTAAATQLPTATGSGTGESENASDTEEDDNQTTAATQENGAEKDGPSTKMYCN